MPIKEYRCLDCRLVFEKFYKNHREANEAFGKGVRCTHCNGMTERKVSQTAPPQFNGSGFYGTDYKGR